ncbi:hypothetical protein FHS95_003668 [Sphingomonas naasensis]|uniref:hypothetical protein n=1 Tax=Sphingomonas naasensis TaxID=1344951 RepID=UPI00141AAA38|nr:hypothetical protein [Sphingomonas naasensis]NIJ21957.1 hypothetical protein [Sphingomonas naasensis]
MSEHINSPDIEYFQRRERQEREHAARTDDSIARRVHLEMAERYSTLQNSTVAPAMQG